LTELQQEQNLAYVVVSHDMSTVEHISDRVAVMYRGRIVELAPTAQLFATPRHPYTRALLSAVPEPDPTIAPHRIVLDPTSFDAQAPLREVAPLHFAALA
jgi:ABC-type oligopeptide transport system ATPase subunit